MNNETKRSYRQFCGLAKALDAVGERWTLLIVRELLLGPRRYGELLAALTGLTTNLLAKRLRELGALGIVQKTTGADGRDVERYELTASGLALEPCVMELARWGGRFMAAPEPEDAINLGWALLSMKRKYRGGEDFVVAVRSGERHFELSLEPERLKVQERVSERAELTLQGDRETLFDLLLRGKASKDLEHAGALEVSGSRKRYRDFLRAFGAVG